MRLSSTCSIVMRSTTTLGTVRECRRWIACRCAAPRCRRRRDRVCRRFRSGRGQRTRFAFFTMSRMRRMILPARSVQSGSPSASRLSRSSKPVVAGLHALDAAGAVVGDRRQRLVEFVRQRRGHFAHGDQARGLFRALLLLQRHFVDLLAVGDVGGDLTRTVRPSTRSAWPLAHVVPVARERCGSAVEQFARQRLAASRLAGRCGSKSPRSGCGGDQRLIAATVSKPKCAGRPGWRTGSRRCARRRPNTAVSRPSMRR